MLLSLQSMVNIHACPLIIALPTFLSILLAVILYNEFLFNAFYPFLGLILHGLSG